MDKLKVSLISVVCTLCMILSGCQKEVQPVTTVGEYISIEWQLISNSINNGDRYRASFTMENLGEEPLANSGWSLFFNYRHNILEETTSDNAEIRFINGDFYRLLPTENFELLPGETATVEFDGRGNVIKDDRAPKGLYFVFADDQGNEIDTTAVENYSFQRIGPGQVTEALEFVPDAESRFKANQQTEKLEVSNLTPILPTPGNIQHQGDTVNINGDTQIHYGNGLQNEARFLADALGKNMDIDLDISENIESGTGIISLQVNTENAGSEAYRLEISGENGVQIRGAGPAGVFYGIQSLLHLVAVDGYQTTQSSIELSALSISDAPRFGYRGMHLDVSRNFNGKEAVFKLLDLMAFYKLNKFHFHLTDDEGWRIQIEELPELTELGAFRGHTLNDKNHLQPAYGSGPYPDPDSSYGSGYYTRKDYKDIIQYAHERHIEVIPEFDVPGHARAAIKAMEARYHRLMEQGREKEANRYLLTDWNDESVYLSAQEFNDNVISVCKESAYRFYETVVDDVLEMHGEADVPLNTIHMGGDEVPEGAWEKSPVCAEFIKENDAVDGVDDLPGYFVERLGEMLSKHGLTLAGWQEIAMRGGGHGDSEIDPSFAENGVTIYSWDNFTGGNRDLGYRVANANYPVVLCNATNLYFELASNREPREPGDYFAGFVDTRKVFEFMPLNFTDPMHESDTQNADEFVELNSSAKNNIKGLQAHLWSEPIKGPDSLEYFYAPKILALAERAWASQPAWEMMGNSGQRTVAFTEDWIRFA
ncbi:MAG: carbohydate-binding domain-containing protein, partial [Bacteroidales bacterium]|nr:carbohydate-binding domain-containing protein [Bacteroidales bacterium]